MVEVELSSVRVDLRSNTPLILLREIAEPHRSLPIFIGAPEATAIAMAQRGYEAPRPLTHDLALELVGRLGGSIERIVVVDLVEATYYADIHLVGPLGKTVVSARPSDAVALAIRAQVPIFVADDLMAREGVVVQEEETFEDNVEVEGEEAEVLDEFREFLNNISPEDFS
ncbi:MAG: bifunctional nuclease family protein [Actinomycetota bacterium]|nr:bifunctional nuclease family protein [Actinomycetota bacterium]